MPRSACPLLRKPALAAGSVLATAALLLAGCGAVVAPSWTITDRGASGFAEKFYRGAATGIPLGEAARRARQTIGRCGNVDRLSYAIYALPQSRLHLE
mgnify:CR=1 FL=1